MTFAIPLPWQVQEAIRRLEAQGHEAYLVGGAVRDALWETIRKREEKNQEQKLSGGETAAPSTETDYDLTTSATPEEMKQVFAEEKLVCTGVAHGTVTVILGGCPLEITTYRREGAYLDHRHPQEVLFTACLEEDLARRDFTINAMAWHPQRGLVDLFGGQKDLEKGLLRCVGEPKQRFQEDALRILRCLRFAATLGLDIEAATHQALVDQGPFLQHLSGERIRRELEKLILGRHCGKILIQYAPVLAQILPEIQASIGFDQHTPYHQYDVWSHSAYAVERAQLARTVPVERLGIPRMEEYQGLGQQEEKLSPCAEESWPAPYTSREVGELDLKRQPSPQDLAALKWAMLFHDLGKPACFFTDEQGQGHFYGHGEASRLLAEQAMKRLRFDKATATKVSLLIQNHDRAFVLTEKAIKRALRKYGREDLLLLMDVYTADCLAQSPLAWDRLPGYDMLRFMVLSLTQEKEAVFDRKALAITGREVAAAGFQGKAIGQVLEILLQEVMEEQLENTPQMLIARVELLSQSMVNMDKEQSHC